MQPEAVTESDKIKQEIFSEHLRYSNVFMRFKGGMCGLKTDWEAVCKGSEGVSASCRKFTEAAEGTSVENTLKRKNLLHEIEEYARTVRERSNFLAYGLNELADQIKDTETQLTNIHSKIIELCAEFELAGGSPGFVVKVPDLARNIEALNAELKALPARRVAFEVLQDRCREIYDTVWEKMRERNTEEDTYHYRIGPDTAKEFAGFSAPIVDAIERALDGVKDLRQRERKASRDDTEFPVWPS